MARTARLLISIAVLLCVGNRSDGKDQRLHLAAADPDSGKSISLHKSIPVQHRAAKAQPISVEQSGETLSQEKVKSALVFNAQEQGAPNAEQTSPESPEPPAGSLEDDRDMYPTPAYIRSRLLPLSEVTVDRTPKSGPLPLDLYNGVFPSVAPGIGPDYARTSMSTLFAWEAGGMAHYPLYFEDVRLERYGQTLRALYPCAQPFASGALFFGTIPSVPVQMVFQRPFECMFPLGYYRPGGIPGACPGGKYRLRLPCDECR